jgi:hypothetical protein
MLKKKKIADDPLTYRLFEVLPTLAPIWLGEIWELRPEWWKWEARFGGSTGEGPLEAGINKIIQCAQRSDYIRGVKKRGMRT